MSIYTQFKVFRFREKLDTLGRESDEIAAPVHIRIKPTNVCGHNCSYCAYRVENLQLGQDMSVRDFIPREKILEIIDDIVEMGVKAVTFSGGGDPFCYPYLREAAIKLSQSSVKFAALTNGSLLKGEVAEVFAECAQWLRVSIDGWDGQSYSNYRGVPQGEFGTVMANIANFKKLAGKCYLGVCIIVNKDNSSHVYELVKQLKDTGVNSIKIAPCIVSNEGKANNEYHQPLFKVVKEQISRAKNEFLSQDIEIFDSYHSQLETFAKKYTWCPYLQILPVIGADLNIYPCQDKAYNLAEGLIGSIKDVRFKDFWFSDKNKFFKINPALHCNHHCVANNKNKMVLDYLGSDKEHAAFV